MGVVKYKSVPRKGESTVKRVTLWIDKDLLPILAKQPNKGRFVNEAIRNYIKK